MNTKWMLVSVVGVLLSAGCSTTSMKGTPFYTGDYEMSEGPASSRKNIWPLFYYRDPAMSVLWPLMEFSPEHQAVRPVYSAYDLDTDHPVYNVFWPLGRFDPANQDYRFFPVYWGDDYFNVVPLYWHAGQPWSGSGHDALFPLWIWRNTENGNSLDLIWPFYAKHQYATWNGWHLWPLYAIKQTPDSRSRYIAWPLIHAYTNATASGNWLAPVYAYTRSEDRTTFTSLPYSFSKSNNPGAKSWDLAIPLCYRSWEGDQSRWTVFPALSWGRKGADWSDSWYALGIARRAVYPDSLYHQVLPLYYYASDPEGRRLYTLPWWWKERPDNSGFHALIPLYYHGYGDGYSSFYSLPWLHNRSGDGDGWHATFPIYYRGITADVSSFYSPVWFSKRYKDGSGWHATIPFYYHGYSTNSSSFYSPVWMSQSHPDGTAWNATFPFYYGARSPDGSILITPFYARKRHNDDSVSWRCYIPLVYVNDDYDAHFMTVLGGRWRLGDRYNWYVLPLLSGGGWNADAGRNIYLAGLAAQQWDEAGHSHYVFPLYYRAPERGTFVSLPYAAWPDGERHYRSIPPLLSGWYNEDEVTRAVLAAGLAGCRSGGDRPYHYVFPLYYDVPNDPTFISLPYASWEQGDRQKHLILPLLSGWHTAPESSGGILAAGLAGYRSGGAYSYSYVFPLYYASPEANSFLSLPFAAWSSGDRQHYSCPLLLSGMSTGSKSKEYMLLGGLGYWKKEKDQVDSSHIIPFYAWSREDYFYSVIYGDTLRKRYYATPLVGRYKPESGKTGHWAVPLYWHRSIPSSGEVKGYWFPLGYYTVSNTHSNHGFLGIYDVEKWADVQNREKDSGAVERLSREHMRVHYLLSLGQSSEDRIYKVDPENGARQPSSHAEAKTLFPVWTYKLSQDFEKQTSLECSSVLGVLYDSRHQTASLDEDRDYLRRRILWRLYHYEKLNGDMSADIFPATTVDSYRNGYYQLSVFWRLFRYEKDPEKDTTKLDLLFIPLKR